MILDSMDNYSKYDFGPAWETAFSFLRGLETSAALGRHAIDGDTVFAEVNEYNTKEHEKGIYEAHRKYVDIQFLLSGREIIGWADLPALEIETAYIPERDVEFLKPLPELPNQGILTPGNFMVFFPLDGHMPGLRCAEEPEAVKKVVVKIALATLEPHLERHSK
ncbi:YhcH/YjgK/YiaL family protein [Maridesulfovibrio sp. FT414]|uniref:YhcH/YjgK/YiaL family protein n=1 Tax=Maridesulfovibrio sp. FT414 TaxID=2979469 RepID=UPI003D802AB8